MKGVQQHMIDKGHCKMLHEGDALLEYSDFYDYRCVDSFLYITISTRPENH